MIVIGAGINGAAIARAAARSGLSVLVVERADLSSGTTGASTRLVHGGLRYLEHGELSLVRESLREREALLELAPHLVEPLALYLPLYRGARRGRWQIRAGMWLYDWLSRGKSLPSHRMLGREQMLARMPALRAEGLTGAACYYDAQIRFPERLVVENLLDAAACGAVVSTHARVTQVLVADGAAKGVEWRTRGGERSAAEARTIVNAAGPWVDEVVASLAPGTAVPLIGGTKGSHIVLEAFPGAPDAALYVEAAADGRPFFVVPWNGMYLVGTTDVRYDGDPADAAISAAELKYLLGETERLFPAAGTLAGRVLYTQAGIRPLPYRPGKLEGAITRRHLIHAHAGARGLYSIVGGKLTTHRSLAEHVLDRLARDGAAVRRPRAAGGLPGAGSDADEGALRAELAASYGDAEAARLWQTYGMLAADLLRDARERPELARPVALGVRLLRGEVVRALDREWAADLVDVLQRRTMVGLGPDCGLQAAAAAAAALCELGVWDAARAASEADAYRRHVAKLTPRALSADQGTQVPKAASAGRAAQSPDRSTGS